MIKHSWNISLHQQIYAFRKTQMEKFLYHCTQDNALHAELLQGTSPFLWEVTLGLLSNKMRSFSRYNSYLLSQAVPVCSFWKSGRLQPSFSPTPLLSISLPGQTLPPCESSRLPQLLTSINVHLLHLPGNWQVLGNEGESMPNQNQTHFQRTSHHQSYMYEFTRKIPVDPNHIWISLKPPSHHSVKFQAEILKKR